MDVSKKIKDVCPPEIHDSISDMLDYLKDIKLETELRTELLRLEKVYKNKLYFDEIACKKKK